MATSILSSRSSATLLTIAGSDPSGGAGLQADLSTFAALGARGLSTVTAVTAQSFRRVDAAEALAPGLVERQIRTLARDEPIDGVKTGMLASREIVRTVASLAAELRWDLLVVDPVFVATSGARLLDEDATDDVRDRLLPLARATTPNFEEASVLAGMPVRTLGDAGEAARRIAALGVRGVIVTGGHLGGDPVDVVWEEGRLEHSGGPRIAASTHGTGCVFSAALLARLAGGENLFVAARSARAFVERMLQARASLEADCGERSR